jgi:hypothetical protein
LLSLIPTPYVVLVNMFVEGDGTGDPAFFADLKEDVAGYFFIFYLIYYIFFLI